jgi:hypothetical protein
METLVTSLLNTYKNTIATMDLYKIVSGGRAYGVKTGDVINIERDKVCFLQRGNVSAHLEEINGINNTEHYNFFFNMHEGMIIGIFEEYVPAVTFEYIAVSDVDMIILSRSELEYQVSQDGTKAIKLFQLLSYMFAFTTCIAFENNRNSTYSIVRGLIYRYSQHNSLGLMGNELLTTYILRRTNLSRSYVFKIISSLKKDGYILLSAGKLTEIKSRLPIYY